MVIRVDLLHDHGRNPTQGERLLVGKMLENAYNMGYEAGLLRARGCPMGHGLKDRVFNLITTITRYRRKEA